MWVVFAAAIGLAQLVTYERTHNPRVKLGKAVHVGRFLVRLPEGWERSRNALVLEAQDPEGGRRVILGQFRAQPDAEEPNTGDSNNKDENEPVSTEKIPFNGLHLTGSLEAAKLMRQIQGQLYQESILQATAVLPDGDGIVVKLFEVNPRLGSGDRSLIEQIAAAITADPARPAGEDGDLLNFALAKGDNAAIGREGDAVVFTVQTARPAGEVKLFRQAAWPARIVLRFPGYLAFSQIRVNNGKVRLDRGGQPDDDPAVFNLTPRGATPAPFEKKYEMTLDLQDKGFDIEIPPAMFPPEVKSFDVQWQGLSKDSDEDSSR